MPKAKQSSVDPESKNLLRRVVIDPPKFAIAKFKIRGTAPLVINAFPSKAREELRAKHEAGSQSQAGAGGRKPKPPKNFEMLYEAAKHVSTEGWCGISASAFRNALIAACRLIGFEMTIAKKTLFIVEDGYDRIDHTGLVRITVGEAKYDERPVRNQTGVVDIRPRPMWAPGWEAIVTIKWDAAPFDLRDVANLLVRAGIQIGVGEGRPDSKKSAGIGWGTFDVIEHDRA